MMSGSIRKDDSFFFGDSLVTIRDESPLIVLQMLMCRDPGCFQELCRISRKVMAWSTVEKEERIGRQLVIRTKRVFVSLDGTNHLLIFPTNGFNLYICTIFGFAVEEDLISNIRSDIFPTMV